MKRVLALVLAVLMLFTLAACASNKPAAETQPAATTQPAADDTKTEAPKQDTTLTVWYWGEQEVPGYKVFMEEIVKRFEAANPGVKVDAVLQESDTLYSAFRTAESAGEGPDVQYLWGGALALEDAWLGNLVPVSDYITKDQMKDISINSLAETNWDGKQWGIPAYQVVMSVAFNKKIMKEAGLDPEKPYTTWEDFMAACEAVKKAGYIPFGVGLKDGWFPGWMAFLFGSQNLDSMNDLIDAVTDKTKYSDKKYSEWVYKFAEMKDKGYFNDDLQSLDFYQGQQLLENGKAAMTFHAHAYAVTLEKSMGSDTIGYAPMPIYGTGKLKDSFTAQTQVYVIPKSAKNKELAAKFMLFLQEVDNMKLLYEKCNAFMPNKNFDPAWATSNIDKTILEWKKNLQSISYQFFYPPMFEYEGIVPAVQNLAAGTITADQAAESLDAALVKWREQNPEQYEAFKKWDVIK